MGGERLGPKYPRRVVLSHPGLGFQDSLDERTSLASHLGARLVVAMRLRPVADTYEFTNLLFFI